MSNQITVDASRTIDDFRADLIPILAENGQSFDRLRSTFMIAVQQNPDILKCTPDSLRREISKCAADGVVPDNKEAVLLPYWDKEAKAFIANYQPMVYGIIKRMKELGSVFNIVCEIVCQSDTFTFNAADPDSLSHSWDVFSEQPRGVTRAAYVIFRDDQKRVMHREIMTLSELQAVRNASKAPNSPAWRNFEGEMYQKAVLRRGSKYISINNDKIRALIERADELFDFQNTRTVERANPFTGEVFDGRASALEHKSQAPMDQIQGERGEKQPADDRQQQNRGPDERKAQRNEERKPQGQDGGKRQQETTEQKKTEKPAGPPSAPPDVSVKKEDHARAVEGVEKILGIALTQDVPPENKKGILIDAAQDWKAALPDYLHPLLKSCIEITDWSVRQQGKEEPWSAEHASFVHKVKTLLDVEKLNIGRYP